MYARVAKPKLSLNTSISTTSPVALKSPAANASAPRTPLSPVAFSPPTHGTTRNGTFPSRRQPSCSYATNSCESKSILKKTSPSSRPARPAGGAAKRIQFKGEPVVHPITPIENGEDYYGTYVKMSRDERRWSRLSAS